MPNKVLIFAGSTTDTGPSETVSPFRDRARQLHSALSTAGIEAILAESELAQGKPVPSAARPEVVTVAPTEAAQRTLIRKLSPDVLVACGWENWRQRRRPGVPLVLDLSTVSADANDGPRLQNKMRAISHADFFLCGSDRQRDYFGGWLVQGGIMPDTTTLQTVYPSPVAPPPLSPSSPGLPVCFLYPVGDRLSPVVLTTHNVVERCRTSKLISSHEASPKCWQVALQFAAGPGQELTLAEQSLDYLWRGVPIICADGDELAAAVRRREAGWCVDPTEPTQLESVLNEILSHPEKLRRISNNARRLAEDCFGVAQTGAPLIEFCRTPRVAERLFVLGAGDGSIPIGMVSRAFRSMKYHIKPVLQEVPWAYRAARRLLKACRALPTLAKKHHEDTTSSKQK
ncbi:MAG: hypothetical protein K2R98_24675 [Gemmataceae bacterium]|nr:hypothetical protein [Gemmataceae bacterium]